MRIIEKVEVVNHFNDLIKHCKLDVGIDSEGVLTGIIDDSHYFIINDNSIKKFVDEYINNKGYYVIENCPKLGSEYIIDKPVLIYIIRRICSKFAEISNLKQSIEYLK